MQHNWLFSSRMFFAPDDGSGGSASPTPASPGGGDGGGSSVSATPPAGGDTSPSPAPDTSVPDASVTSDLDVNPWANLGSVDDLNYVEVNPETSPPVPASVVPPVVAPVPTPQQPAPAVPPAQVPPSPTVPEPPGAAPVAFPSPSDPVGIANAIEANRDAIIEHLATSKFALTQEEIAALESDVVTAVPRLMAKMFVESQTSMQKFLAQAVPGMMKNYNSVTRANDDAESEFFKAHTTLDKNNPAHRATAIRLATLYRSANPTVPLGQLIQEVGPMVIAAVGVNSSRPATPPAAPPALRAAPFRPAVGGGGANPNPEPENPWSGLGQNFDT